MENTRKPCLRKRTIIQLHKQSNRRILTKHTKHLRKTSILNKNIEKQFDKITREIIQVKMSLSILTEDINKLAGDIHDLKRGE